MLFTNKTNIPMPLAVWLASLGDYDLEPEPGTISASTLLKPLRALVLAQRVTQEGEIDLSTLVPSKLGTAVHTAVEVAWKTRARQALTDLGMSPEFVSRVVINPGEDISKYSDNSIFVYVEQRKSKKIGKWTISGKFDCVIDGKLYDIKTTKTYNYISGSNDYDYQKQGSIYAWLNPSIVTHPRMEISYLFTDWSQLKAQADPTYPQSRCITKEFVLDRNIESWIKKRLALLEKYEDADQEELPLCTEEELWQTPAKYALYKDPAKTQRATKLFDHHSEAILHNATKYKGKGLIVERPGEVKRCIYCPARPICDQAKDLELKGLLKQEESLIQD